MIELSEENVIDYLRQRGQASAEEVLVKSLSGGVANVVLQVFDIGGGPRVGTDLRSEAQKRLNKPDPRPHQGSCMVLKQPLPKFKTEAEWLVDIDRVQVERDCMTLLGTLLPAGSVPEMRWFDEGNHILAMSCAPVGAVLWKKALLGGSALNDAGVQAGMLLAMMHSSTKNDAAIEKRYGDPKFFIQQRIDPYLRATAAKHPTVGERLEKIAERLLAEKQCLIHGDFSPKNIFLVPHSDTAAAQLQADVANKSTFELSHLLLLDFEVAFYGHPAFDVATLINHFALKGFYHRRNWRPFMLLVDVFWDTYLHTADPALVRATSTIGGHMLAALLLARIDGKSPAEYLLDQPDTQERIRRAALSILAQNDASLDFAIDAVSSAFEDPA
jgi:Phosphotransferase enzyme family